MTETIRRVASMRKMAYQLRNETKYTSFNPPTYSVLDDKRDTDRASEELLNNKDYKSYCDSILKGSCNYSEAFLSSFDTENSNNKTCNRNQNNK